MPIIIYSDGCGYKNRNRSSSILRETYSNEIISNNRSLFEAILLIHSYFYDFKLLNVYTSIRPSIGKVELEDKNIRELLYEYDPLISCIYFKLLFDDPYCAYQKNDHKSIRLIPIT
ncbi:Uncharacterized protein FWK35_00033777 [Aphis craccivora]|uniref:Uncharacterized protein n=1 Tax=Aphis craccivora TaxID=307492 RepID=A0A6G0W5A0_APHCR|nr:Uncharacterized protein FWK35_00033777 [Aphis craccivora]